MADLHFDAVVVGSGPAGSTAALVLARAGARVAIVDKVTFPRDKACGDLIGPRGVQVLADLGITVSGAIQVGDMAVVGPSGRPVRLPCHPGSGYADHALAVPRHAFDADLREAAVAAGAFPFTGQVLAGSFGPAGIEGVSLADGRIVKGQAVIGADGAISRVAEAAGLVDRTRVLWGFAVRSYVAHPVELPTIVLWEPTRWHALSGYGWLFPGPDGMANVGLGVGTLHDRAAGSRAAQLLPAFLDHLRRLGLLTAEATPSHQVGGWLKMGIVGTVPAAGRVLLVGDAAGLVNPLQGEGIAHAMRSARAAAHAVLAADGRPDEAAATYRAWLASEHLAYHAITSTVQTSMLSHPRALAGAARVLTFPGIGSALAPGWSVFWNELLDGAAPGRGRAMAAVATRVAGAAVARTATSKWLDSALLSDGA